MTLGELQDTINRFVSDVEKAGRQCRHLPVEVWLPGSRIELIEVWLPAGDLITHGDGEKAVGATLFGAAVLIEGNVKPGSALDG